MVLRLSCGELTESLRLWCRGMVFPRKRRIPPMAVSEPNSCRWQETGFFEVPPPKKRKNRPSDDGRGTRVRLSCGELTESRRLWCVGLVFPRKRRIPPRAVCEPNSCRWQETGFFEVPLPKKRKNRPSDDGLLFFGSGTRIRTQTYRVRVCCATFTQFRYVLFGFCF